MLFKSLMKCNSSTKIRVYVSGSRKGDVVDSFMIDYCGVHNFEKKWALERLRATVVCVSAGDRVLNVHVTVKDIESYMKEVYKL